MRLSEKSAVVTGGGRGIGRAIALALAREGACLAIVSDVEDEVQAVAVEARALGVKAMGLRADVTRTHELGQMTERVVGEFGRLDILVNNAGIAEPGWLLEQPEASWRRVIEVNLIGTYLASRVVLPQMTVQREGRIINIASVYGRHGGFGFVSAYAASKHGVIGLTRALASELGVLGYPDITVNAVCPGYIRAGMGVAMQKIRDRGEQVREIPGAELFERYFKHRVPQRRMLEAEEVANVVIFLALPETRGMTGQALTIDGGFFMD
ncbi:MAG: SDR family NAD(P)-dependent oxidoreductase [Candidatus Methylomirabilia bacterium]